MNTTHESFTNQLHDMWRTRPIRLPGHGPVAGVAAGIGHRYGIDPVVVRVAFVVSTVFGGAGIVAYIAGWLFLPKAGDPSSAAESLFGRGHSSESQTKTVVLLVALAIAVSTLGPVGVSLGGSGLISGVLLFGGLWLLHQRQPTPPPLPIGGGPIAPGIGFPNPPFATVAGTSPYSPYTKLPDHYEPDPPTTTEPQSADAAPSAAAPERPSLVKEPQPVPPAWDPLGVAPFAWDLPEPAAAAPVATVATAARPRSRFTPTVLGLALLAAAGAGSAAVAGADWLTPGRVGAIALAVIGLGLVAGAFLRRGHGLLVITGPLIGFVVVASLVGPIDFDRATFGEREWRPTSADDLDAEYAIMLGSGTLDLRSLTLTDDRTVAIDTQLGEMKVILPADLDVRKNSTIFAAETTGLPDGLDGGGDGTGGPVLTLDINTRLGNVEVNRG